MLGGRAAGVGECDGQAPQAVGLVPCQRQEKLEAVRPEVLHAYKQNMGSAHDAEAWKTEGATGEYMSGINAPETEQSGRFPLMASESPDIPQYSLFPTI